MNNAKVIALCIVTIAGVLIFGVATGRLFGERVRHVELPRDTYPIVGVDLSAHNGDVDFDRLAASVDFVFLKASEGKAFKDASFGRNYHAARESGIKVGAYHFFRFDSDGESQGRNFLDAVGERDLDLPLAIDIEEWGNPPGYSTHDIVTELRHMIFVLEAAGRKVIIYTNKNGYVRFVKGRFDDLPLWICSFSDPPISGNGWLIWQHSHKSRVDGASDEVDMNTFNGDSTSWERWLAEIKRKTHTRRNGVNNF